MENAIFVYDATVLAAAASTGMASVMQLCSGIGNRNPQMATLLLIHFLIVLRVTDTFHRLQRPAMCR